MGGSSSSSPLAITGPVLHKGQMLFRHGIASAPHTCLGSLYRYFLPSFPPVPSVTTFLHPTWDHVFI